MSFRHGFRLTAGGKAALLLLLVALAGSITVPRASAMGLGLQFRDYTETESEWEAISRSGAGYYRLNISWFRVQQMGSLAASYDNLFKLAAEKGITIIPDLYDRKTAENESRFYGKWESEWGEWLAFVKQVVKRYGYHGEFWTSHPLLPERAPGYWEIWNEPNLAPNNPVVLPEQCSSNYKYDSEAQTCVQPRHYAEFLVATAAAIREVQEPLGSGAGILAGGLYREATQNPNAVSTFLNSIAGGEPLAGEFKAAINGLGLHPYSFGGNEEKKLEGFTGGVSSARSALTEFAGSGKELWITEAGWPVAGKVGEENVTPIEQGELLRRGFTWLASVSASYNIPVAIWYDYGDITGWEKRWDGNCGLRTLVGTFRPAWYEFQALAGVSRWPVAPSAVTGNATGIAPRSATINASVNPHGLPTTVDFQWGTSVEYGNVTSPQSAGWAEGEIGASQSLTTLLPATTYHYRIVATNENAETTYGADQQFTTPPDAPEVKVEPPTGISRGKATLHGTINPWGAATKYRFEWGATESYGSKSAEGEVAAGLTAKAVEAQISGLKGLRTYYYRLVAENVAGSREAKGTFQTPDWRPVVTTEAADGIATYETEGSSNTSRAVLHGLVNPKGFDAHYHFEYGTAQYKLNSSVPLVPPDVGSGEANVTVATTLEGLQPKTTYYFRISAESEEGTTFGQEMSFTTPEWALLSPTEPGEAAKGEMADIACTGDAECLAVGNYTNASGAVFPLAERRSGGSWSVLTVPTPGALVGALEGVACNSTSDCVAVGRYVTSAGATMPLAERWNGSSWSAQSTPAPAEATAAQFKDVSCSSSSACTAVGYYTSSTGASLPLAERWNGSSWALQTAAAPSGFPNGFLLGVSCSGSSECWAVGEATFNKGESGSPRGIAERWNGTAWTSPVLPGTAARLTGIACPSSSSCAAVGSGLNVERYDGSTWSEQAAAGIAGGTGAVLMAISCRYAAACTAVGSYTAGGHTAPVGERWDGSAWSVAKMTDPVSLIEGATGAALQGVSCASSSACTTVGYRSGFKVQRVLAEAHRSGLAPTAVTEPATGTAAPEAVLNAVVNPDGEDTTYRFEYDTAEYKAGEGPHGTSVPVPAKDIGSGIGEIRLSERVSGLVNKQTYHFRIVAENAKGTTYGTDRSFTMHAWSLQPTLNQPPRTEDTIESTSCPGATTCLAVGYDDFSEESFAELWNGSEWRVLATQAGSIKRISCPTTSWCTAIGYASGGGLQYWRLSESSGTWSLKMLGALPLPTGATSPSLRGLSCASSTACTAVGAYYTGSEYKPLVERWNGSVWSTQSAPNPTEGSAQYAMLAVSCPSATLCVATGEAAKKPYVERWGGSEWVQQTSPAPTGATESTLEGISCSTEACMAVGHLVEGGKDKPLAERWNGKSWSIVATPMPAEAPGGADLYAVSCPTSTACTAVGRRITKEEERKGVFVPTEERTMAESWNGTEWAVQATPNPEGDTFSLFDTVSCTAGSACTAMGTAYPGGLELESQTLGERWNGSAWSLQTTANPPPRVEDTIASTSCPGATTCVAVGYDGFSHESFAEAWNGVEWRIVGSVEGRMKRISCPTTSWCAAVGYASGGGLQYWRLSESSGTWSLKWLGSLPLPSGATYPSLGDLSCTASTACTAVGAYYTGSEYKPLVERWNGSEWSLQSAPNPAEGSAQNAMLAVSCSGASACTAVGEAAGKPVAERWNGSEWSLQSIPAPTGATESTLESISCLAEGCMAVGHLVEGGKDKPLAEHWNGKNWSALTAPMPAEAPGGADLYSVSCPTVSSCFAVGRRISKEEERKGTFVATEERTLAEFWNGTEWAVQATPNPAATWSVFDAVSCPAAGACTAMGTSYPGALGMESLTMGERYE